MVLVVTLGSLGALTLILTTVVGLRRAADQARAIQEGFDRDERAELLSTVVKLANKDNNQGKLLVEGLKEVTKTYTESLTKLVIGYQPSESNRTNSVLDLNSGENTFPLPGVEYVPPHELADPLMWDNEQQDNLMPIPPDGSGGWVG